MKNYIKFFGIIIVLAMVLTGCADAVQVKDCISPTEHVYGFWGGTWHGIIMGPAFIGSLFSDDIAIYAVNNNGFWYNFGFVGGFFTVLKLIGFILGELKK